MEYSLNQIKQYISNLKNDKNKSNFYGEVFTPPFLIQEMINIIPRRYWQNENIKILDNSCGVGNFTVYLIEILMNTLYLPQLSYREKYYYILKNNIFLCDIQDKNYHIFKNIFNFFHNFHVGDFLDSSFDKKMKEDWGIEEFDIVIGNPPFNNKRNEKTNGNIIWDKFVYKSYHISKSLCLVHPNLWRKPLNNNSKVINIFEIFKKGNLLFLNMNDSEKGKEVFNTGTNYDYYFFEKNSNYNYTHVIDQDENELNINIKNYNFLSNKNIQYLHEKYFNKNNPLKIIFDSKYHNVRDYVCDNKSHDFPYPLINSISKKGVKYKYSSYNNKGHFGYSKIILSESNQSNFIVDDEGKYGMTQNTFAIVFNNRKEKEKIISFLKSNDFKLIKESCRYSNYRFDANVLKNITIY